MREEERKEAKERVLKGQWILHSWHQLTRQPLVQGPGPWPWRESAS